MKRWRAENPEKTRAHAAKSRIVNADAKRASDARWRANNPEKWRVTSPRWAKENPEKAKAAARAWGERNRDKRRASQRKWVESHPERRREVRAKSDKKNRPRRRAAAMKRIASQLQRTPVYADLKAIQDIYLNCPKGFQVDHTIPLQGDNVSGFHIETNLQYLTEFENVSKRNRFEPIFTSGGNP
jgi:membrane protein involved in colicin uptake